MLSIVMTKWSFQVLFGYLLHCKLVLDAVQAWTLVPKSVNAFHKASRMHSSVQTPLNEWCTKQLLQMLNACHFS